MHTRLLIAIAVSGAVHAGAFIIGEGLYESHSSGLDDVEPTTTLTVSVVSSTWPATTQADKKEVNKEENRVEQEPQGPRKEIPAQVEGVPLVRPQPKRETELQAGDVTGTQTSSTVAKKQPAESKGAQTAESHSPEVTAETHTTESDPQFATASTRDLDDGQRGKDSEKTYLMEFLAELSRHKFYPRSARSSRQEGKVVVSLVLRKDGSIDDVELAETSRFPVLNRAAVRAVKRIVKFKPFPPDMNRTTWHLSVPFRYSITDH